jgi:hypothetical protein
MKTKNFFILFSVVFAILGGAKVGFAQGFFEIKTFTTKNGGRVCVKVDPVTKCLKEAVLCETLMPRTDGVPVKEILRAKDRPVEYVAIPNNPCQNFVFDNGKGNTTYYCSGGYCYPE